MTLTRPLGQTTVVIIRAPLLIDVRDNSAWRSWDDATRTTITKCMVEPFPMAEKLNFEDNRSREFSRTAMRFFLPKNSDVQSTDRIEYDSKLYDVFGTPGPWVDFSNKREYVAVIGRIREG